MTTEPVELVVTGGQSGVDIGAWRAARALEMKTAGWMPRWFLTESGPRPEYADQYGARQAETSSYRQRTIDNIALVASGPAAALILNRGDVWSPGTILAYNQARLARVPVAVILLAEPSAIEPGYAPRTVVFEHPQRAQLQTFPAASGGPVDFPSLIRQNLLDWSCRWLFVGGNRESRAPGIGAWSERWLKSLLKPICIPNRSL